MAHAQHSSFRPMAEVAFRPARQLSEYKGKGASASREQSTWFVTALAGFDKHSRFAKENLTDDRFFSQIPPREGKWGE